MSFSEHAQMRAHSSLYLSAATHIIRSDDFDPVAGACVKVEAQQVSVGENARRALASDIR